MNNDHSIDAVLGQRVTYPQRYEPQVLVSVPRQLNRAGLGIADEALPFVGADAWHAYEVSCLTSKGLPTAGIMKIVVPCDSRCIVESKSLKLYLNSFNMEPMGETPAEAMEAMTRRASADLSALLQCDVRAYTFEPDATTAPLAELDYATLEEMPEAQSVTVSKYTESPELLTSAGSNDGEIRVKSHLLRSNCRVTHQPDWGTVFIRMAGGERPDMASLLAYIVSMRGENHFHEEICEMIFRRMSDAYSPKDLMVTCCYTRRGGIDINPSRATRADWLPAALTDVATLTSKLGRC